ncbi:MAG TPA: RNA polymerase sigma factor [Bryobacteraceae bacterium]|nr:RNA polymerase sigma factor [Bryobacteraceae bacterium]
MADRLEANLDALADARDLESRFSSLMASEQKRVFLLCRRMLQDPEDADSATQDTFLKAWQALKRPESGEIEDAGKWITRIAVNTCLDRLRSRRWQFWRKRPKPEDESSILSLATSTAPDAEDQLFAREIARRLEQAIEKLSLRQRAAFTLRHYEDRSLAEIAEILKLDVGTVKVHLFRATEKLREELHDLYFREMQ